MPRYLINCTRRFLAISMASSVLFRFSNGSSQNVGLELTLVLKTLRLNTLFLDYLILFLKARLGGHPFLKKERKNKIHFTCKLKSFSLEWLCFSPRFDREAKSNTEMGVPTLILRTTVHGAYIVFFRLASYNRLKGLRFKPKFKKKKQEKMIKEKENNGKQNIN